MPGYQTLQLCFLVWDGGEGVEGLDGGGGADFTQPGFHDTQFQTKKHVLKTYESISVS